MQSQGIMILVSLVLAVALAAVIISNTPVISLAIVLGVLALALAFLSTNISLYVLVFAMLLGPQFLVGGLEGGTQTAGRGLTLRFDDFLLVVMGLGWLAQVAIRRGAASSLRTPLNRPIMFYIGACVFATMIGMLAGRVKPTNGFFFLFKYYEYVFIYFMVVQAVTSEKQAKRLIVASLVTCFLVSLFAISQIPSGARVSAPFEGQGGEPNTLGGYLVFMLAIVTGLLLTTGAVKRKLPLLILLGAGGLALSATLSRSSYLAIGVVALAVLLLMAQRKPMLFPFVLVAALAVPLWAPDSVKNRIMETFTQPVHEGQQVHVGGVRLDTSTSDRLRAWETAGNLFKVFPVWGTGVTGGPFMDTMYPRVLSETGLLGLAAFLALLWRLFRMGVSAERHAQDPFMRGVARGFVLGLLGLMVHAVGTNTFIIVRIMEPFWLFAALVVRSLMIAQANQAAEVASPIRAAVNNEGPGRARMPVANDPRLARLANLRKP